MALMSEVWEEGMDVVIRLTLETSKGLAKGNAAAEEMRRKERERVRYFIIGDDGSRVNGGGGVSAPGAFGERAREVKDSFGHGVDRSHYISDDGR